MYNLCIIIHTVPNNKKSHSKKLITMVQTNSCIKYPIIVHEHTQKTLILQLIVMVSGS